MVIALDSTITPSRIARDGEEGWVRGKAIHACPLAWQRQDQPLKTCREGRKGMNGSSSFVPLGVPCRESRLLPACRKRISIRRLVLSVRIDGYIAPHSPTTSRERETCVSCAKTSKGRRIASECIGRVVRRWRPESRAVAPAILRSAPDARVPARPCRCRPSRRRRRGRSRGGSASCRRRASLRCRCR